MSADIAAAASLAEGIELIDEDDAGRLLLRLLEHIADSGRPDADEHFDEVGTAEAEEGHPRFAGDGFGKERFARSRRADEKHPLGDAATEHLVFLGRLEEFDNLAKLVDGFLDAGNILERDLDVFLGKKFAAAATKGHRRPSSAHPTNHEDEEHN